MYKLFRAFRYQFHQYWSRFFHGPMALKFYLAACLLLLVLSLIRGSKAIGNADGAGSNGSFIPTRNGQVSLPVHIIVLLWTFYLRLKVWLRYWGLGCGFIQRYYTSRENIVRLRSDLRFESIISQSCNINLPGSTFYFFQLSHLYIMARRIKTPKSVTSPPQPLSWKEFLKNLVLAMLLLIAVF